MFWLINSEFIAHFQHIWTLRIVLLYRKRTSWIFFAHQNLSKLWYGKLNNQSSFFLKMINSAIAANFQHIQNSLALQNNVPVESFLPIILRFLQELERRLLLKIEAVSVWWEECWCWPLGGRWGCKSTKDRLFHSCLCCPTGTGTTFEQFEQLGHGLWGWPSAVLAPPAHDGLDFNEKDGLRWGCCGTGGTLNTGSLENEALRPNLYGAVWDFRGEAIEAVRPCLGGLAVSEDSLHLFGNVGKCILSKDGWKTDSAIPGGIATRCKYKVLGASKQGS